MLRPLTSIRVYYDYEGSFVADVRGLPCECGQLLQAEDGERVLSRRCVPLRPVSRSRSGLRLG
jgi:hypothetical protein